MALGENRKKNGKILLTTLNFYSLPIIIILIYGIYVILLRKNIDLKIPEMINFNNNPINIKKLYLLDYDYYEAVQFLKLYDFLISLILILSIPYLVIVSRVMFGTTPRIIKSYLFMSRLTFSDLVRLILGMILFSFGFFYIGVYFLHYLMGFESNLIGERGIELFIFYRILLCSFSLIFTLSSLISLYKYILLKHRLKSKKNAKVV
jgi:hypothetical protein